MSDVCSVSKTNTGIDYYGFLDIKLKHKGKVFPLMLMNKGTKFLFDSLTKFLAGYSVSDCAPKYFDFQSMGSNGVYRTCLQTQVRLTGAVYGDLAGAGTNDGRVKYNAIITYEDKGSMNTLRNPRVALKDSNSNEIAVIEDENLQVVWESIVKGTEAVLEWTMVFKNQGETR